MHTPDADEDLKVIGAHLPVRVRCWLVKRKVEEGALQSSLKSGKLCLYRKKGICSVTESFFVIPRVRVRSLSVVSLDRRTA